MLKKVLIFLLSLVFSMGMDAQKDFRATTHIGVNGGINLIRVGFSPVIRQDLMTVYSYGLVFRHVSEPHIGTQVEVNYSGRGWIENRDTLGTYKRAIQTLDIPVMAAFIAGSKTLRFAFTIGPYVSRRLSEKETIDVSERVNQTIYRLQRPGFITDHPYYRPYYLKPLTGNWEIGFTGGLAIEFHTRYGTLGLRGSYSHALNNLFPLNADEFYYNSSRSQVISAGLTYFVNL